MLAASFCIPRPFRAFTGRFERPFAALARRKTWAISTAGTLAFLLCMLTTLRNGIPEPYFHDENSYLLAADTFVHGRLANPTHPLWQHFETVHVIHHPTYASKYPPGQGLFLALGKIVSGHFIVGAWIATGLAVAALCWMLYGYFSEEWAFFGGLMAACHSGIQIWGNTYWGGNLAVIGGSLVFGAALRINRAPSPKAACIFGVGVGFLTYTRLYEGIIFVLLVLSWLCWHFRAEARVLSRLVLPGLAALLPFIIFLGFYNATITGSPLKLPYTLHESEYGYPPLFVFQKLRPMPAYRHPLTKKFHTIHSYPDWAGQQSLPGLLKALNKKFITMFFWTFRTRIFLIALFGVPFALRNNRILREFLLILFIFGCFLILSTWFNTHYAAPVVGLIFVLLIAGFQFIARWHPNQKPVGRNLIAAALILNLYTLLLFPPNTIQTTKEGFARSLLRHPGKHLVFVDYAPEHHPDDEWVYNGADFNEPRIVWAHPMGGRKDHDLIASFPDRQAWRVNADAPEITLKLYSPLPSQKVEEEHFVSPPSGHL